MSKVEQRLEEIDEITRKLLDSIVDEEVRTRVAIAIMKIVNTFTMIIVEGFDETLEDGKKK